jgi:hypothetical protein
MTFLNFRATALIVASKPHPQKAIWEFKKIPGLHNKGSETSNTKLCD